MNRIATSLLVALSSNVLFAEEAAPRYVEAPAVSGDSIPETLRGQELRPLSLAAADFDGDGVRDLAAGFGTPEGGGVVVLYSGNADALYPHSPEARQRRELGRSVAEPFLSTDRVLVLSAPPDFLHAGDFDADGHADLAAAAAGGSSIQLLAGDGVGGFGDPRATSLPGAVRALAAGDVGQRDGLSDLVAAVEDGAVARALVFRGADGALRAAPLAFALEEPAAALTIEAHRGRGRVRLLSASGGTRVLESAGRTWRIAEAPEEEMIPKRRVVPAPADAAAMLPNRVGPHAQGSVVLRNDGSLSAWAPSMAATFVVDVTTNLSDAAAGNGICADTNGDCSLRAAIEEANALAGLDTITFAIPGGGVPSIPVASLPVVIAPLTIDGTTQSAGRVAVTGTTNGTLLTLNADGCTIRGLVLNGTGSGGLRINGGNTLIEGNYLGTTADGSAAQGDLNLALVVVSGDANRIGGTALAARNIISGPSNSLIRLDGGTTTIEGNYVGTDVTGTVDLGGDTDGIRVFTAPGNTIGGAAPGAGNLVSGHAGYGIRVETEGNLIQGNRVGTDASGSAAIPNVQGGVTSSFAVENVIGGTAPGAGNLISGNGDVGLLLTSSGASAVANTQVQGNRIGLNASGTGALPNEGNGIHVVGGTGIVIGGTSAAARNVISGNLLDGIYLDKFITVNNVGIEIHGNYIGTDVTGTLAVPNLHSGIYFLWSEGALIGGTAAGEGNVISGNLRHGIDFSLTGYAVPATIQGNLIGVNAFGMGPLGNSLSGIDFPLNTDGIVGGTGAGQANVFAFNGVAGIGSAGNREIHTRPNIVYSNGGLGHDIGSDGPTPNFPGVSHNFPVITMATDIGGGTNVAGILDAQGSTNYQVHIYSSPSCDPSGYGEGREYRKTVNFTTDGAGHGVFLTTITPAIPGGRWITAFAVGPDDDDASEFSFCRQLVGGPPPEDVPLEIFAATPPRGGNTGPVTVQIAGQGMVPGATARLERSGSPDRVAEDVTVSPDGYTMTATFDLDGAAEGDWDVTVTIPGDTETLPAAFTVEEGTDSKIWADILGRGTLDVRSGRERTFFVVFGNRGNTDSPPTLFQVSIPWQLRVTAVDPVGGSARVVSLDSPMTTGGSGRSTIWIYAPFVAAGSSTPVAFRVVTIAAQPGEFGELIEAEIEWDSTETLSSLFDIPVDGGVTATVTELTDTPAHFEANIHYDDGFVSGDLHFDLEVSDVGYETAPVLTPTSASGETEYRFVVAFRDRPEDSPRLYSATLEGLDAVFDIARRGPGAAEARRKERQEDLAVAYAQDGGLIDATQAEVLNDHSRFATALHSIISAFQAAPLAPGLSGPADADEIDLGPFEHIASGANAAKFYEDYQKNPETWNILIFETQDYNDSRIPRTKEQILDRIIDDMTSDDAADRDRSRQAWRIFAAIDPNEKSGPGGAGDAGFVTGEAPLSYTVTFENLETANAAAQEVVVTDILDGSKLDFSTFELGPITFGSRVVAVPPGLTEFTADVDLRPGIDLIARVTGGFDPTTGVATWHFFSLDPATGLPTEDPILGFLPPNVASPEGEGHVSFLVRAKTGLASGTEIHNQASIVFDANPAIVSADWFNTIDITAPSSAVAALPAAACSGIVVSWSGADAHSGVASYDVFVSEDAGPFEPWLTDTSETSRIYHGAIGSTYAFFSVARDAAGNEEAPGGADATTTLSNPTPLLDLLEPDSGPATGAPVTLTGSGFEAGATVVVGGQPAGNVVVNGATSIDAFFPALAPGLLYDVTVVNASTCADTLGKGWLADFGDVPQAHTFHDFVEKIVRRSVTAGCSLGNYCPGNPVTRSQMAVFLIKAKYNLSLVPPAASGTLFADVPAGSFAADWIEQLAKQGVTSGCGGGNYCPGNAVTREQMAVFLLKTKYGAFHVPPPATGVFDDVPAGDPFAPWIEQLAAEGITGGCGDDIYCPDNPVTRGQMAVFLTKTFSYLP